MTNWRSRFRTVRQRVDDESGQGLAEYALILSLIAVVCAAAVAAFGQAVAGSQGFKLFDLI